MKKTIIEQAIVSGIKTVADMVREELIEPSVLVSAVNMMCTKHGTEFVAGLMMEMPNYEEIKNMMDEVA